MNISLDNNITKTTSYTSQQITIFVINVYYCMYPKYIDIKYIKIT